MISWVWLFVGSNRSDAEFQMRIALLLSLLFCSAGAFAGFQSAAIRRMALRWREGAIRWCVGGREACQEFASCQAIDRGFDGGFQIRFRDGTTLKLDGYAKNAGELLARLSEAIGKDSH